MKLFLAWANKNDIFCEKLHCVNEMRIYKCMIMQRETEAAVAVIETDASLATIVDGQYALISFDDGKQAHLLFRGKVAKVPRVQEDGLLALEFNAGDEEAKEQIETLMRTLDEGCVQTAAFEPGFYDHKGLAERLESRSEVMCWDRCTGALKLSHIFHGRCQMQADDAIFEGTLKVNWGATPLNEIDVVVEANWVQRYEQTFDLAPLIEKAFPNGRLNTLTAKALIKQWPRVGEKIGTVNHKRHKGYEVVKSHLYRLGADSLLHVKQETDPLYLSENGAEPSLRSFKYAWFKGGLWVNWVYQQPCSESVAFTVRARHQNVGGGRRRLVFRLPDASAYLKESSAVSVLREKRGHALLDYAKAVAFAHMAGSARQMEVEFSVPFADFYAVTLDATVTVTHKNIPNGCVTGKVIRYALVMTPDQWYVSVTLAAPFAVSTVETEVESAVESAVGIALVLDVCRSEKEESYVAGYVAAPAGGWEDLVLVNPEGPAVLPSDPSLFTMADLVETIRVGGDAFAQEEALRVAQYPLSRDYREILRENQFFITAQLRSLEPKPVVPIMWQAKTLDW